MAFSLSQLQPEHGGAMAVGVVIGGIVGKLMSMRHEQTKIILTEADAIRKELREDVAMLQGHMDRLRTEIDLWKDKYYRLADENVLLRSRCKGLEMEVGEMKSRMQPIAGAI